MPSLVVQLSGPWLEHVQPCLHQLYVLKTTFPWRPLPSFSLLIIHYHLPSDSCRSAVGQVFSFFVVLAYAWLLFEPCFLIILADNLAGRSTWRLPWLLCACFFYYYTPWFETPTTAWRHFFLRDEQTVVLHSHPLLCAQLSVGPRCDFDLHLYMSFLQPVVTRRSHGLGLGNRISVAWFLCDSSIWFRRFT